MNDNVTTFNYPNMIIRVHRPTLTDDEKTKRMNDLINATERFMKNIKKGQEQHEYT